MTGNVYRYKQIFITSIKVRIVKPYVFLLLQSITFITHAHPAERAHADSVLDMVAGFSAEKMIETADSLLNAGDNEDALSLYLIVARWPADVEDGDAAVLKIKGLIGAGDIQMRQCDYARAMDSYVSALFAAKEMKAQPYAATIYKNIGNVYCCLYDYESGIRSYKRGLEVCRHHPDKAVEKKLISNLAGMISYTGDADEAQKYLDMMRGHSQATTDVEKFLDNFLSGLVNRARGNHKGAIGELQEAAAKASRYGIEPRYLCSAYQELYSTYRDLALPDSTLKYLELCLDTATKNGISRMFPSVLGALSDHYHSVGNLEMAREYRTRYLDLRDSIMNERDFNAVKNVLFQHNATETANEIRDLHRQKTEKEAIIKKQAVALGAGMIGLGVVCCVLAIFYFQKRRITRSYRSLYEINREYAAAERRMEERHKADIRFIEQQRCEIARLKEAMDTAAVEKEKPDTNFLVEGRDQVKYSSSNLGEHQRGKLAEAITSIMENEIEVLCNPDFSLACLARLVESNPKYVSQTINEEFNRNFSTFVNHYRVKLACERLSDRSYDSYKVKYIGESVGFKSQTTFTEAFRKHTGLSPAVYRKLSREENNGNMAPQE